MSYHNCQSSLCVSPHYENDSHSDECFCEMCHTHEWREWRVYPECDGCIEALNEWLRENVDVPICACGSARFYAGDFDNPECLACYSARHDAEFESQKEAER